ncbi:fluG-like protein [Fusarium phyllophilum]|uniref:FluG-like protein n=1 Tax=Fusarium phyllophilum TaxID=47803 RepID=A0A8H5K4R6_9HYPO|nr:fluG-like protein [Fusarium phyllophilum]
MSASIIKETHADDAPGSVEKFFNHNPSVQVVVLQWVDICGISRTRLLPTSRFRSLVKSGGHLDCAPLDTLVPTTGDFIPQLFASFNGKGKIHPDVSSIRAMKHDAFGIGNAAHCVGTVDFQKTDARLLLKDIGQKAEDSHGLKFLVGIELELCLLVPGTLEAAEPAKPGVAGTFGTLRSKVWPILNEIIIGFSEAGIEVEQVIKEYGTSAYELALPPLPPIEAVDTYYYAKELIQNVAHKHGILATFYPTPYDGEQGQKSGQHIHISATPMEENKDWGPDDAMAGMLSHIPALMALGMCQVDSYERVNIGRMCTGGLVGWGDNNRDMPVRRVTKNHWEIRVNDATSNSYAMVAGIIGAALDPKPLTIGNAAEFTLMYSDEERKKMGLTELLPTSLEAALKELEDDRAWADSVLGQGYIDWFLALKRAEMKSVSKMETKVRRMHMLSFF